MKNMSTLDLSIRDFFSKKFLLLSFAPFFAALLLFFALMFLGVGELLDIIKAMLKDPTMSENYPLLGKIVSFAAVHYILAALLYLFGTFLALAFGLVVGVLTLGFLTPIVVKTLHEKYYSEVALSQTSLIKTLLAILWIFVKFVLILIVCVPFMFVPVVNLLVINLPFFYLFYNLLVFDVVSNICDKALYQKLARTFRPQLMLSVLVFYFMALLPIIGLFLQLFFAIYLTHFIFKALIKK